MALCEAAAYYKTQGKTLWDAMIDMYEKYGYYKDDIQSITLKGIEGLEKIQSILETLRKNPPKEIGGYQGDFRKRLQAGYHPEHGDRRSHRDRPSEVQRALL